MRSILKFLRPMAYLRRRAILGGVFGGNKTWLAWGGAAWVLHWIARLLGVGDPEPRYTQELSAGERVFVVHEPLSPLAVKKAARKTQKAERRSRRRA